MYPWPKVHLPLGSHVMNVAWFLLTVSDEVEDEASRTHLLLLRTDSQQAVDQYRSTSQGWGPLL